MLHAKKVVILLITEGQLGAFCVQKEDTRGLGVTPTQKVGDGGLRRVTRSQAGLVGHSSTVASCGSELPYI